MKKIWIVLWAAVLVFFGYGVEIEFYGGFQGVEYPDFQRGFHHMDKVLFLVVGKNFKIQVEKFRDFVFFYTGGAVDGVGRRVEHVSFV